MESLSLSHSVVNNLNSTLAKNAKIHRHLQTGRRIMDTHDDAGAFSVNSRNTATLLRNKSIQQNLQGSLSLLQAQDGMLDTIGKILDRCAELKTKFESPLFGESQKAAYDDEFTELQNELRQIAQSKWNGISLFSTQNSKTLFGPAVDGEKVNQESSDHGDGNTLSMTRWGIYHLEPPVPPTSPFGIDFLAITLSDESHGVYSTPGKADGENDYLQDKQNWESYLSQLGIDAKIAVAVNENRTGNPSGPLGGNVVPTSMIDADVENSGVGKVFRGAGRDDFSLPTGSPSRSSAEQAQFIYDEVFKPMVADHGLPKAMGIFVDNSGSLEFKDVNQGILEFVNIIKANHPEVVLPDENYTTVTSTDPEGQDLGRPEKGFFKGIRLADDENWIEQSQIALQELVANDPAFFDAMKAPDGADPTYQLDDYSIEDFEEFMGSLASARAQNGAEQSRVQHELLELQSKQIGLEQSLENADGLDYSLALTRYSRLQDQLHMNANLVAAAKNMENVLYTDYLGQ